MQQVSRLPIYEVYWDSEFQVFVGICPAYPSLSWTAGTVDAAYVGIKALVKATIEDMIGGE